MKIAAIIARILLGLVFVIFGSNAFLNFIHAPMPTGLAGQFFTALFQSHWVLFIGGFEVIGGALLLIGRYIPLGLTILGPLIVNILLYHFLIDFTGAPVAIVVAILWIFLFYYYRQYFTGIFTAKTS